MRFVFAAALVSVLSVLTVPAEAAQCSAQLFGQTVPFTCPDPVPGPAGPTGPAGAAGLDGQNGVDGIDGKDGSDADALAIQSELQDEIDQGLALSAAMSSPVWLGDSETVRISGGVGFTDGASAVGVNGLFRVNRNLAAFAGGAVSTEDTSSWAGRAGLSVGW